MCYAIKKEVNGVMGHMILLKLKSSLMLSSMQFDAISQPSGPSIFPICLCCWQLGMTLGASDGATLEAQVQLGARY